MAKSEQSNGALMVAQFYIRRIRRYPRDLLGLCIALPLTVLANVYIPALLVSNVLSRLSQGDFDDTNVWANFGPSLVAYLGLLFIGLLLWRVVDLFMWRLELNVQKDLAEEVFGTLLNQTADFHANSFSGSLVSKNNKLLTGYIRLADTTIFQVAPMLIGIVIATIIMAFKAPIFALALFLFSIAFLVAAFIASRPVRRAGSMYSEAESRQTGYLADALTNSMAIKSFATSSFERERFETATSNTRSLLKHFARTHQKQINVLGVSSRIISAVALLIAVVSVLKFKADIGVVFLILSYTSTIVEQLFQFGNSSLRNYNRAIGDSEEMVQTLAVVPAILDPVKPQRSRISKGAIAFQKVHFTHDGADDALFEDFSLDIKAGEKVGLVGHSGSGKSTFTRLLLRFSDVQQGHITIDGQAITAITQDDLHQAIAYVPQEPLLFHRSITENIGYGAKKPDAAAITKAADMAHASEFINLLPVGYDTLVGERGVKLSGGQRQRIAIARAMLKNAPIILLDEATSALDSESEVLIQDALWKLMEGRTAIVIAHRLSTIQKMDRIIVMDNGAIVEQGTHAELLKRGNTYAKLWAHQSGGFMED